MKIGDRVGALISKKDGVVRFLGWGTYAGEHIPGPEAGFLAPLLREAGLKNPRIDLDSGKSVYGCECWWGPPSIVDPMLAGAALLNVDIDDERRRFADGADLSHEFDLEGT